MEFREAESRLNQAGGRIVIQWQSLVNTLESFYGRGRAGDGPESTFSQLIERWRAAATSVGAIDQSLISKLHTAALSYHLVRDAIAHGTPSPRTYLQASNPGTVPIHFRMRSRKSEYKLEWKEQLKSIWGSESRFNLAEYLRIEDKVNAFYNFHYSLSDIEHIAYNYLDDLQSSISLTCHIVSRSERGMLSDRNEHQICSLNNDPPPRRVMPLLTVRLVSEAASPATPPTTGADE